MGQRNSESRKNSDQVLLTKAYSGQNLLIIKEKWIINIKSQSLSVVLLTGIIYCWDLHGDF